MGTFPERVVFEVEAEDGAVLRGNRYPRPGGRAVVCGHGLASTNYEFDLPLAGFNLAEKLYAMGYEVWAVNWRGSGHSPANSGARDWRHSGDWPGAVDLPAIMAAVEVETSGTGKRPFYFGHSFGGMTLYAYLQGTFIDRRDSFRVKRDPDLARERNARLAGAVTAGSPVSMHGYEVDLIEKVRRSQPAQAYFKGMERLLMRLDRTSPRLPLSELALGFGLEHPRAAQLIMTSPLASFYLQPRNMGREAMRGLRHLGRRVRLGPAHGPHHAVLAAGRLRPLRGGQRAASFYLHRWHTLHHHSPGDYRWRGGFRAHRPLACQRLRPGLVGA